MSWTNQETIVFGADTVIRQIGDGVTDAGHRLTVNGAGGTPVALALVSEYGTYRGVQPEFNLRYDYLPTLFDAVLVAAPAFPSGSPIITTTAVSMEGFNTSFSLCIGDGTIHSWAWANNAGAGGDSDFLDSGGGPSDADLATEIKTRVDAEAISGLTVGIASNVLTFIHADGIVVFTSDAGVVLT